MDGLMERFLRYVAVDTRACVESKTCPSTQGQLDLARILKEELEALGLVDVSLDEHGYVMGRLPKNTNKEVPTIGFLAHLDTAAEFKGDQVQPQIIENYDGGDVVLNEALQVVLSPKHYPNLKNYLGKTLILTDGTTLLGVDDKAGIAEIVTAVAYLIEHPEIPHGDIMVAFSPDEEIGRGPLLFDVKKFGAQFAYTLDGGPLGEFQYENFNAASATLYFKGNNIHPGHGKDVMVSALIRAMEFHESLPRYEAPQYTTEYEGYYHLMSFNGDVEFAKLMYYIRDFSKTGFELRKMYMEKTVEEMVKKYGPDQVKMELRDVYYNMRQLMEEDSALLEIPQQAMRNLGIEPVITPIRGGTDGAQLSYKGMLTPNLFIGGENFHGKFEFAALEDMEMAARVVVEIVRLYEER